MTYPPPMSYQQPFGQPPARRRPATVTAASALMLLGAAVGLIGAITILAAINPIVENFRDRAPETGATTQEINDTITAVRVGLVIAAVLTILLAVLVGLLAFLVLRGSNAARITTWVLVGLSLCCGVCGLFGTLGSSAGNVSAGSNDATADAVGRALQDSIPNWLTGASGGLTGLQILGYIAVAVLLALPASNAFFRKAPAGWQPSMTPPGGPPDYPPQYPPPGYPSSGPPPGYPSSGPPPGYPSSGPPPGYPSSGPPPGGPQDYPPQYPPPGHPSSGPPTSGPPTSGPPTR